MEKPSLIRTKAFHYRPQRKFGNNIIKGIPMASSLRLEPKRFIGSGRIKQGKTPLAGAVRYVFKELNDGFECRFPAGTLAGSGWLSADFILEGKEAVKLALQLTEGRKGPVFNLMFGLLNQCQARLRFPLSATDQRQWMLKREGALLKPLCWGDRVDLARVDRLRLVCMAKTERPLRLCLTPLILSEKPPARLTRPLLVKGALLDRLGQSTLHRWPGKSRNAAAVTARLKNQHATAGFRQWPRHFSRWGGWRRLKMEGTGFFRTYHDGKRWWLADPDGHPWWSAGCDCVRVDTGAHVRDLKSVLAWKGPVRGDTANYLQANLERAFGKKDWYRNWSTIALAHLRAFGFNTVANWSDWRIARAAGFPYVRPLSLRPSGTPAVFRDFPDVFHPGFAKDAESYARQLAETRDDPALVGYFIMNEPTWGFASQVPAEGMLLGTEEAYCRNELARWLKKKYGNNARLAAAWGMPVTPANVKRGVWTGTFTPKARADLAGFSTVMVETLFTTLTAACKRADPNHLNLGARYYTIPPGWAIKGMRCFDVFSINCYTEKTRRDLAPVCKSMRIPALVGEWHFGSLDAGLPATGIGRVATQAERGRAYRVYLEDAAALPWCVGVHWFTLYDQSALGRGDGENYNIGFLDVCNRPYPALAAAGRAAHERMYRIRVGKLPPYDKAPKYLTRIFY